ncbi:hypothetical protein [Thalassobacillus devorans]|uniref:hypothetical protein n=1 Tax=Thalassobacillus devorans TaxID=279813 RepID=UPI00048D0E3D|nr:hypothetical protein [Thalassobacillus devorans]
MAIDNCNEKAFPKLFHGFNSLTQKFNQSSLGQYPPLDIGPFFIPFMLPFIEYSVSRETVFRYGDGRLEVREITRFPWVDGELPQAKALRDLTMSYPPIGVSQFPGPPYVYEKNGNTCKQNQHYNSYKEGLFPESLGLFMQKRWKIFSYNVGFVRQNMNKVAGKR